MKGYMQIASSVYFLIVAAGLFLWIHFFSADILIKNIIPVVVGLIALWFLFIYAIMKREGKQRSKQEEEKR